MKAQAVSLLALALSICTADERIDKEDTGSVPPHDTGAPDDTEAPPEDTEAPAEDTASPWIEVSPGPETAPEPGCVLLDFDTDADGDPILAGQDLAEVYAGHGVHIATWDQGMVYTGLGIAFDSGNPPGTDYDLGTPNEAYGGPGIGAYGASNDEALHNLLIRAENTTDADGDGLVDVPDDHVYGATFVITMDSPQCVTSLDFIDIDETPATMVFLDATGAELATMETNHNGDNARETVEPDVCDVSELHITIAGSGAIDGLSLCAWVPPCETSLIYGVEDQSYADSQLFVLDTETGEESLLGPLYADYDFESIEVDDASGALIVIAAGGGSHDGELYEVDKDTGALTLISTTTSGPEIVATAFHPDGSLWAFREHEGLVTINRNTGETTPVWDVSDSDVPDNWEGIAWDAQGTTLYAVNARDLIRWDPATETAELVCGEDVLPNCSESMDISPEGVIHIGLHAEDADGHDIVTIDPKSCAIGEAWALEAEDVEGIAFEVCE